MSLAASISRCARQASRPKAVVLALTLMCAISVVHAAGASAAQVPVTVTIQRFIEVQDPDPGPGQGCCGDYYGRVSIDGQPFQESGHEDDDKDVTPYWRFTRTVDDTQPTIPVTIQVFDDDTALAFPDDIMDLNPVDGKQQLDLQLNPRTGTWSGDVPANVGFSQGDGDHEQFGLTEGGEAGKILFDLSLSADGDIDDDGIPDGVERFGVRNADGNVVADLAAMGADPCRPTIALQIDWMADAGHTHRPLPAAVTDAVGAMNAAPVTAAPNCPYAGFPDRPAGVNLVIDQGNQIAEQAVFPLSSLAGVRDGGNFDPARRPYFHYVLFTHDQSAGNSSSGICCVDNRDFIVSLGSWSNSVGTARDQSGTILHEGGHAFGLGHGGLDSINYKPNYLSVMNYSFDPTGIPDPTIPANIDTDGNGTPDQSFRLDYSRSALDTLKESALNEAAGVNDGTDRTQFWDPVYQLRAGAGSGAIDFNNNGVSTDTNVRQDVNRDYCVDAGDDGTLNTTPAGDDAVNNGWVTAGPDFVCNTAKAGDDEQYTAVNVNVLTDLPGYEDWSNIKYRAPLSVNAAGASVDHGPDVTFEDAQLISQATFALYSPDLALAKTVDKADAGPGDQLAYKVTTRNVGTGAAKAVTVTDTLPDATQVVRNLGVVGPGASPEELFTYTVPCATADGASVVNQAAVLGTNLLNNPEVNLSNNSASATTTVHAPVLTLGQTATATVNAGEAITYRLTYANTGSGAAQSVVVTSTLPAGMYYSTALDLGSGPAPTSVTRNADGTTTLSWSVGSLAGGAGPSTIEFTARPSLLLTAGETLTASARLTFTNANGCTYTPLTESQATTITAVAPSRNPLSQGFFKTHPDQWTSEFRARIQATDQRFDSAPADGQLSPSEVEATFDGVGASPGTLRAQLLGTLFNLAQRRINAATTIVSKTATARGVSTVAGAVRFAQGTLALPPGPNAVRYSDAIRLLDEINQNRSERY